MRVLRNQRAVDDGYQHLGDSESIPPAQDVFISLDRFESEFGTRASGREGLTGVRASGDTELDRLARVLPHVDAVALELPKFTDGRAYSTARLLRERFGWRGELRAVGNVLRDQLFYLVRCGFDVFELNDRLTEEAASAALSDFTVTYQAAVDERLPLWRRRRKAASRAVLQAVKDEP